MNSIASQLLSERIEGALEVIRDAQYYYWLKKGIIPSWEEDEAKFRDLVDTNQMGVWLWLRFYMLNDLNALQVAISEPFCHLKPEAELHHSWYKLAQEFVSVPKFKLILHAPSAEMDDPLYWLVVASSNYFEIKMRNSGWLKHKGIPASPKGKSYSYKRSLKVGDTMLQSSHSDLVHERQELEGLEAIYQLATVMNILDRRFTAGEYLHEAVRVFKRVYNRIRTGNLKTSFLDKYGNLVQLANGQHVQGFVPEKIKKPRRKS